MAPDRRLAMRQSSEALKIAKLSHAFEFDSGGMPPEGHERQRHFQLESKLDSRYQFSMNEYDLLVAGSSAVKFGTRNVKSDFELIPGARPSCNGNSRLFLTEIREYHRHNELNKTYVKLIKNWCLF